MKSLILKFLLYLKINKLKKNIDIPSSCILTTKTQISLLFGSRADDIKIGNRVILKGTLVSEYGGKIIMGNYSQLGFGSKILSVNSVIVGDYTAIAGNVVICDNNNHPVNPHDRLIIRKTLPGSIERSWKYSDNAPIIIGENCWIGENSRICKGVTIGDGSIVAANSVVTKNVPANCIVAGNPAKIVKTEIEQVANFF